MTATFSLCAITSAIVLPVNIWLLATQIHASVFSYHIYVCFVFRSNSNSSSTSSSNGSVSSRNSGTREVHNKLEKNRRAHLKECFELLKSQLPTFEDRKISNLAILRSSLRHIQVNLAFWKESHPKQSMRFAYVNIYWVQCAQVATCD